MGQVLGYHEQLTSAMTMLAENPRAIFVGQCAQYSGTTMTDTLRDVPMKQRLEFPVAEDFQMGFCIGLALDGWLPICMYPRWNFLILALNQLVNHLDKMPRYNPRIIIRVVTPDASKFDPGPQHNSDFSKGVLSMLTRVRMVALDSPIAVRREYEIARDAPHSTLLVEFARLYGNVRPSGVPSGMGS